MGIITINKVRLQAHHGVLQQERRVGNTFEVSMVLDVPAADNAMLTDDLADTINYAEVVEIIKSEMSKPSQLIEAVAGRIQAAVCARFGSLVAGGEVTVAKIAPPIPAELESVAYTYRWQSK